MPKQKSLERGRVALGRVVGIVLVVTGVVWPLWAQSPPGAGPEPTPPRTAQPERIRPNIVIFLIDALRANHLGVYGYDRRPTSPRIDALAREAVVFEQAYAPTPWTLPTVVSLMTSTFPAEHGTLHNRQRLSKSLMPLAERLRRFRYATFGLIANAFAGQDHGLERGYDVLQESPRNNGKKVGRLLDAYPAEHFFLYVHNIEPHTPYHFAPPHTEGFREVSKKTRRAIARHYETYRSLGRVDFHNRRPLGMTDNTREQDRHLAALTRMREDYIELYDASTRVADTRLGSVVDLLQQRGLWDNTLFILLSDHGDEFGEHGGWLHDQAVYEEQLRVPLIIHFPRGQYAGRRVSAVVSLVDILPTIFAYLQRPNAAGGARGRNLMPLIQGDTTVVADDFVVPAMRINARKYYRPWKESRGDINVVIRKGGWKGIWNVEPNTLELYNLSGDPGEQHDVSVANSELALAMQAFARLWYEDCGQHAAAPPGKADEPDEETLRNLRLLGYVD
jgi:arylsulfatase A-like enzyme